MRGEIFWAGNRMASSYVNLFGYGYGHGCFNHDGYDSYGDGVTEGFLGRELHGLELRQPLIMKTLKWLRLYGYGIDGAC